MSELLRQLRAVLAIVWELVQRRPFLAWWPALFVMWIGHRDVLDRWIEEAKQGVREKEGRS